MTTTTPALTASQRATLDRARALLAQDHGHDAGSLAYRLGQVEYYLGDILTLVDQIAQDAR